MTLAVDGIAVAAWKCSPGASTQQWTGYSDGTLRLNGKCLDVTGPQRRRQRQGRGVHRDGQPEMANQPGVLQQLRAHHQHRHRHGADRPRRQHDERNPAGHGTRPRRPDLPLARLLPSLHGCLTRRHARPRGRARDHGPALEYARASHARQHLPSADPISSDSRRATEDQTLPGAARTRQTPPGLIRASRFLHPGPCRVRMYLTCQLAPDAISWLPRLSGNS